MLKGGTAAGSILRLCSADVVSENGSSHVVLGISMHPLDGLAAVALARSSGRRGPGRTGALSRSAVTFAGLCGVQLRPAWGAVGKERHDTK